MDNKQPFLWSLTETDITFCEVLMNMYAAIATNLNLSTDEATAALFAPADSYGQTFTEWGPYIAQEMGIPFSHNEQFTDNANLLRRLKNYYGELARQGLVGQQLHERQLLRHRIAEPARGTGSHVHIVNSANFGNLYTTGPQEFFTRQ